MLQDQPGKSFRVLDLCLLIAGPTDADSDKSIALEYIQRATEAAARPKRFVADARDLLRRDALFLFFLAPFVAISLFLTILPSVTISVARLLRFRFAIEFLFPELLRIARARSIASLRHRQTDGIGKSRQGEETFEVLKPASVPPLDFTSFKASP